MRLRQMMVEERNGSHAHVVHMAECFKFPTLPSSTAFHNGLVIVDSLMASNGFFRRFWVLCNLARNVYENPV